MRRPVPRIGRIGLALWLLAAPLLAQEAGSSPGAAVAASVTRTEDRIYGRKHGLALTLDVFTPKPRHGGAVIWIVSGGWYSHREWIQEPMIRPFLDRGYTVFAVVHGSQPKFTIPEAIEDVRRAVRFVRHGAGELGIDPDRIAVTGTSAGGHLALVLGTRGDSGNPDAEDPVERASSRVQAVGCFFPPTDVLHFGREGHSLLWDARPSEFTPAFDIREFDRASRRFERVADRKRLEAVGRDISPIYHTTEDDAPALLVHGAADRLVPIEQSERMVHALRAQGVPAELVRHEQRGHGWLDMRPDLERIADWFDDHLGRGGDPRDEDR